MNKLLSEFRKALGRLHELKQLPKSDFLQTVDKIDSAKYNLILVIEAAIDICNHLVSQNAFRAPDDYADCFEVLAEKKIIPGELLPRLQNMVRFRNRLVHIYWDVDDERTYDILQNNLADVEEYLETIVQILDV
jgi:uncharacterized protein YutE (UPF0331/DUF86 family)